MSKLGGKNMSEDTDRSTSIQSVVAGDRISVDNTDPNNPIVTADVQAGGQVDSVVGGTNCSVDATDPVNPIVNVDAEVGIVATVVGGTNCSVDATDAANPIVNADTQNNAKVTTKGDLEGFNTVAARIPVGTDTHVLTADSGEALGLKWAAVPGGFTDPLTTKGDVMGFDTGTNRIPVGTNGQHLEADSTEALGVKWATPSAGGDVATDTIFDAKGDLAGGTGSDTAARLPVGSNDQVLTADSAEATGMKWAAAAAGDPLTTKGDIMAYDTDADRVPVGTDDQVLTADSTNAFGVAWKDAAGGGGSAVVDFHGALVERTASLSRNAISIFNDYTAVSYDTDSFADLGTNDDRLTVPAGVTKVQVTGRMECTGIVSGDRAIFIHHKNSGGTLQRLYSMALETSENATHWTANITPVITVAVGDYFEMQTDTDDGSWTQTYCSLSIEYKDGTLVEQSAAAVVGFHGALVENSATIARTNATFTPEYTVEAYDTDGFGNLGTANTRLTIPAGVTKVIMTGNIDCSGLTLGSNYRMQISRRNSSDSFIQSWDYQTIGSNNTNIYGYGNTPVIKVDEGDYFTLSIQCSDTSWSTTYMSLSVEYKDGTLVEDVAGGVGSESLQALAPGTGFGMMGEASTSIGALGNSSIPADRANLDLIYFNGTTTVTDVSFWSISAPAAGIDVHVALHPVIDKGTVGNQAFLAKITTVATSLTRQNKVISSPWQPAKGWYWLVVWAPTSVTGVMVNDTNGAGGAAGQHISGYTMFNAANDSVELGQYVLIDSNYDTAPNTLITAADFNDSSSDYAFTGSNGNIFANSLVQMIVLKAG